MQVSVADAKNKLPELIKAAEKGEPVTICRRGVPVVDIVRTKKPAQKRPKLGTLRGKIKIFDPDWWKPMTDEEVEDLFGREVTCGVLLDTAILIFAAESPGRLSKRALAAVGNPENIRELSSVSLTEIADQGNLGQAEYVR